MNLETHPHHEPSESSSKFHQRLRKELEERLKIVSLGGGLLAQKKQAEKGKLFVRTRIQFLLDPDTFFLELSPLAAFDQYENQAPCAGLVTGIGSISGKKVMIIANDSTVKGGSYFPLTVKKHLRAQKIAEQNHLPCLYLVDSGGAFLPLQDQIFPDEQHFGRLFYNQARMSALGIPQISVVLGSCTAGGAYVPALSDETIIVQNQGTLFLAGPPLVEAATGEKISAQELGGADLHCKVSGVTDYLAQNEHHAFEIVREIFLNLPPSPPNHMDSLKKSTFSEPLFPLSGLDEIIPKDPKKPFDIKEIIQRTVDGSEFQEFKPLYGQTLVTGFASIWGYPVGILGNNGVLFPESAQKATHFIQLCSKRNIPLLFLQNITGFMVGKQVESQGIAKEGAKMVSALANTHVPKLTLIVGGSFGAGNYGMCGRAYEPRFLFIYPHSRTGIMGGEQAASVLNQVKSEQLKKEGKTMPEKEALNQKEALISLYEKQTNASYSTSNLWDDGMISPHDTRKYLALALSSIYLDPDSKTNFGVFRM